MTISSDNMAAPTEGSPLNEILKIMQKTHTEVSCITFNLH